MTKLTEGQGRFLQEPNFGIVAALRGDGSVHQSVVWVDWDGEHVLVNLTTTRAKLGLLQEDRRISLLVLQRDDAYTWLGIEGEVAEITTEGAEAHMHHQAGVYFGRERYDLPEGEQRVLVRIAPQTITTHGVDERRSRELG